MGNAMHRYGGGMFVEYDPEDWQPLRKAFERVHGVSDPFCDEEGCDAEALIQREHEADRGLPGAKRARHTPQPQCPSWRCRERTRLRIELFRNQRAAHRRNVRLREEVVLNAALRAWQEVLLDLVLRDRDRLEERIWNLREALDEPCETCGFL